MRLIKQLDTNSAGTPFALWGCSKCPKQLRLSFKIGRSRYLCYDCQQKERDKENILAVYTKNSDNKQRTCLLCDKLFKSSGKDNRRCSPCQARLNEEDKHGRRPGKPKGKLLDSFWLGTLRQTEPSDEGYIREILFGDHRLCSDDV